MELSDLATELERKYNIRIVTKSAELKKYRFTGTLKNETFEQVLEILQLTTPLKYELSKGKAVWDLDKKLEKEYSKTFNH